MVPFHEIMKSFSTFEQRSVNCQSVILCLALILTGMFYRLKPSKRLENAAFAFYLGIGLFCGSLYLLSLSYFTRFDFKWMGAITPVGGISFIVGWAQLAWGSQSQKKS